MRVIVTLVFLSILSGCSSFTPSKIFGVGVGNTVYSADLAEESAMQEAYSGILCSENGLPMRADGAGVRCSYAEMGDREWKVFVNAGIYDIDRRCDEYLAWLYEMKNSKQPMLTQITRTGSFAAVLLKAFNASTLTIDLAAAAFGYASDTFTNFDPNLLFGVESSSIQTIVLTRQQEAKVAIHKIPSIASRPEAMHTLRGYLRVCMPFTIQSDINTMLALKTYELKTDLENSVETTPQVTIDENTTGSVDSVVAPADV